MKKRNLTRCLIALALVAVFLCAWALNITCPILYLSGIPCPTCGVTRAMISFVCGYFGAYLRYNVMALPLCIIVGLCLLRNKLKHKKLMWGIVFAVLIVNFGYYLIRLIPYLQGGEFFVAIHL